MALPSPSTLLSDLDAMIWSARVARSLAVLGRLCGPDGVTTAPPAGGPAVADGRATSWPEPWRARLRRVRHHAAPVVRCWALDVVTVRE